MVYFPPDFIEYCAAIGYKLTSLRKEVLFILWRAKRPLKAYDILAELVQTNANAKPPAVYRSLLYFVELGIVHKIDSIQSYTLCEQHENHPALDILMVCDGCHQVAEVSDAAVQSLLKQLADNSQFVLKQDAIELKGLCRTCA